MIRTANAIGDFNAMPTEITQKVQMNRIRIPKESLQLIVFHAV